MEDVMRIRIKTPDELKKFAAVKYAAQFVKEGHLRIDDPRHRKSTKISLVEENEKTKKYLPKLTFL